MSDNGDSNDDKSMYDEICRDFLRNVCKRADRCRYRHPSACETETLGRRTAYTFCHDYQNAGCHRPNCKFLHCSREEEDYYKQTGQLPVRLQQAAALGIGVLPNKLPILKGEVPICKDYLRGECKRSLRCKYRHMSVGNEEYTNGVTQPPRPPSQDKLETSFNGTSATEFEQYETFEQQPPVQAAAAPPPTHTIINSPPLKRRRPEFEETALTLNGANGTAAAQPQAAPATHNGYEWVRHPVRTPAEYCLLEEENMMLRRKVDELKKQASDLAATNEVLLEQNARFRSSRSSAAVLAQSVPPIVTVSQVVTPTITGASAIARTPNLQPVPLAATSIPPPQLNGPAANGHLVMSMSHQQELIMSMSQQAVAPRMAAPELMPLQAAPALNPTTAQPAAPINGAAPPNLVPASITIDNLAVPVSVSSMLPGAAGADINGANIAGMLGQQQTSMAPPLINGSVNGGAGTSRSLVSYPIMSHTHTQRSSLAMPITSLTIPTNSPNMPISTLALPPSSLAICPPIPNNAPLAMPNGSLG